MFTAALSAARNRQSKGDSASIPSQCMLPLFICDIFLTATRFTGELLFFTAPL
jgi:hypothetical protein